MWTEIRERKIDGGAVRPGKIEPPQLIVCHGQVEKSREYENLCSTDKRRNLTLAQKLRARLTKRSEQLTVGLYSSKLDNNTRLESLLEQRWER